MLILVAFFLFICFWFRIYFSGEPIPAVDLPGHIALVELLSEQLTHGSLRFYDTSIFLGWPAFQFYGFGAHLLSCALAIPLGAQTAVHALLVLGVASLPFSLYFALRPLAGAVLEKPQLESSDKHFLALISGVLSFWFLNQEAHWFGVGAGAVMQVGLYSQLLGWHLMLVYFGLLISAEQEKRFKTLAVVTALLLCTHTLSAVFCFLFGGLWIAYSRALREKLIYSHLLGAGLSAFWLCGLLVFLSQYSSSQLEPAQGDFLSIVFRYSPIAMFKSLVGIFVGGFTPFDFTNLLILILCFVALLHPKIRQSALFVRLAVIFLVLLVFLNSRFVGESIGLGIHYYRFVGLFFWVFILLLGAVSCIFTSSRARLIMSGLFLVSFGSSTLLPEYQLQRLERANFRAHFLPQEQVLNYFSSLPNKGRVFFEYFKDPKKLQFPTPHYISSQLYARSGFESVNGLFRESSSLYQFLLDSGEQAIAGKNQAEALETLRDFGVSHFVLTNEQAVRALANHQTTERVSFGPFHIVEIRNSPLERIKPNAKLNWDFAKQEFQLEELRQGVSYVLNYSYFPYWSSEDGKLSRASDGRIHFVPTRNSARIEYRAFSHWSSWFGLSLSLASLVGLIAFFR